MVAKVLISSIGSGVGYGILRALRICEDSFYIIGLNSLPFSAGVFQCDATYLMPPIADRDAYLQNLLDIVKIERPDILFPGRDADLVVLAGVCAELKELGTFLMAGSLASVQICTDKYRTAQYLRKAGHPFAPTGNSRGEVFEIAETHGYPLVVKPVHGFGSSNIQVVWDQVELADYPWETGKWIAQKFLTPVEWGSSRKVVNRDRVYLDGKLCQDNEYSVQVLLGYREILGVFTSKNTLQYGMPFNIEVINNSTLTEYALAIARTLQSQGLIGPCNLQAKKDIDDGFVFFEVNARYTGITPVRAQMGFNEVLAAYQYFIQQKWPTDSLQFQPDQMACRFLSESIFTRKDLDGLQAQKKWVKRAYQGPTSE